MTPYGSGSEVLFPAMRWEDQGKELPTCHHIGGGIKNFSFSFSNNQHVFIDSERIMSSALNCCVGLQQTDRPGESTGCSRQMAGDLWSR